MVAYGLHEPYHAVVSHGQTPFPVLAPVCFGSWNHSDSEAQELHQQITPIKHTLELAIPDAQNFY